MRTRLGRFYFDFTHQASTTLSVASTPLRVAASSGARPREPSLAHDWLFVVDDHVKGWRHGARCL